jgi:hypothetical protein
MTRDNTSVNSGKNVVLAELVNELGWSHARVMREVNGFLGTGYVGRSSVAEWVNNGRLPREPLPTVVAHLLSAAVGRTITVTQLWGHSARESEFWIAADHGQALTWDFGGVLRTADDWVSNVGRTMDTDRRRFMAISGAALTAAGWGYLDTPAAEASVMEWAEPSAIKITPAILDVLETTISGIRRLDAVEGGNLNTLRVAHRQFCMVAEWVKSGNVVGHGTHQRLLDAWANLCHIAGWMAVDAQQHGLAQRYYFTGLQVTKTTGNKELAAHFLGALSQHASHRGMGKDATELADAAVETAKGARPIVQSLVWSRAAEAQAVMGNAYGCQAAIDKVHDLGTAEARAVTPHWMYWFNQAAMESRSGWSTLLLAKDRARGGDRIFSAGEKLLAPHAGACSEFPRDHLVNASWLARSYVWRGEIGQAMQVGMGCLDMLPKVNSPRVASLLGDFMDELKQHRGARGSRRVAELTRTLQTSSGVS